ncbi:MAG TPA: catechol 1,2-dioxygenase [Pseudonocardiaceae bacterium]|jgi:catechol 1,2-dioxygenase|nr:catechol 1,2-dioxygenase [Pseudonocardiaceae bacterium]
MDKGRAEKLVSELERTLIDFIRTHDVTHDEYRLATQTVVDSVQAGEESLLFDVFCEAAATDSENTGKAGSVAAIEGPFYLPGAPRLAEPYVLPQRDGERGDVLTFQGTVHALDGTPLGGTELDMWQADADGCYSNIHPGVPEWNLRGRFTTAPDGTFRVATIVPPPYEIPKDGPTGRVLRALGRHFFRPAHLHLKLRAEGYTPLTSQLYFADGDYLDSDVAGAVRDGLVVGLDGPDGNDGYTARYDFVLEPAA